MSTITRHSGSPAPSPTTPTETTTVLDEERGVMRDVSWQFYDRLSDAIGEQSHIRVAYDGKDMEIMTLGPKHERSKVCLDPFVTEVCMGLKIDFEPMGSTTWKRSEKKKGLESDLCYYFDQGKLEVVRVADVWESNEVADYPNPDLAIEVDISPSKIDRPKIYASLKVSEIWRFKKKAIVIEQLQPNGVYLAATSSQFLHVRPDEVTRWFADRKSSPPGDWIPRLREWIQTVLKARVDANDAPPRPTGRRRSQR
jgi:Uma2 family endonuclease